MSSASNGSTYKVIPAAIFRSKGQHRRQPHDVERESRRMANAVIGIAGAAGAFGGVLVNIAFRQSFLTHKSGGGAYVRFTRFYLACSSVAWLVYLRPSAKRLVGA